MEKPFELYTTIGQELEKKKDVEISQMFGKPCLKIKGKAFASFFQDEMVFKLSGKDHEEALKLKGAQLFDPSGKKRPMKEWVQVPVKYSKQWKELAMSALKYVEKSTK
jgi:hypothetical protein